MLNNNENDIMPIYPSDLYNSLEKRPTDNNQGQLNFLLVDCRLKNKNIFLKNSLIFSKEEILKKVIISCIFFFKYYLIKSLKDFSLDKIELFEKLPTHLCLIGNGKDKRNINHLNKIFTKLQNKNIKFVGILEGGFEVTIYFFVSINNKIFLLRLLKKVVIKKKRMIFS